MSNCNNSSPDGFAVPVPAFHPEYDSADHDADLVLLSSDGLKFRVQSTIMKLASGVFRTMLEVSKAKQGAEDEPLPLQEGGEILKALLDVAYPDRTYFDSGDSSPSFDLFREVCYAAEKYEMPGVLYAMRIFLHSVIHDYPPILSYALACRYGWMREAKLASIESLSLNLMSPESQKQLEFASSGAILNLLGLHFSRRDLLIAALDNIIHLNFSNIGEPPSIDWLGIRSSSNRCQSPGHLSTPRWTVLKYRIKEQMEKSSKGQYLRQQEFWDQEEFTKLWEFTCACSPGVRLLGKEKLKSEVLRVLDNLRQSI